MKGIINVLREKIYWIDYKEFISSHQSWGFGKEKRRGRETGKGKEEWGKKNIFL